MGVGQTGTWRIAAGFGLSGLLLLAGCGESIDNSSADPQTAARIEGAPMCPWRNPQSDVPAWFPDANLTDTEILIMSGLRPELAARLGRSPTAEEHALYVHRVWRDSVQLGEVLVRRVKGES